MDKNSSATEITQELVDQVSQAETVEELGDLAKQINKILMQDKDFARKARNKRKAARRKAAGK
jgi:hypothetical protein